MLLAQRSSLPFHILDLGPDNDRVGIILGKEAQRALIDCQPVNHRIIITRFNNRLAKETIIQAYAPTEASEDEEKDEFYSKL